MNFDTKYFINGWAAFGWALQLDTLKEKKEFAKLGKDGKNNEQKKSTECSKR